VSLGSQFSGGTSKGLMKTRPPAILRRLPEALIVAVALIGVASIFAQAPQPAPSKPPSNGSAAERQEGVTSRGDHAMGFPHETTTHHFRLYNTGGAIEVLANDASDSATRDEIRMHLSHIVKLFSAGDFHIPMFIHDAMPPGAAVMSKRRQLIRYHYQETERGAKIQITTADSEAQQAIHAFLRFQIADHQTGDTTQLSKE
jgi:hypothetical protein